MKPTVYIDTTIPSFYFDERPEFALYREITRDWWDNESKNYNCFSSYYTQRECRNKKFPNQELVIQLAEELPLLEIDPEIDDIIEVYIKHFVMPNDAQGDAAHLAMASFHNIDYLLTWNCVHLANASKYRHIEVINLKLGISTPMIITPQLLCEEGDNAQ